MGPETRMRKQVAFAVVHERGEPSADRDPVFDAACGTIATRLHNHIGYSINPTTVDSDGWYGRRTAD